MRGEGGGGSAKPDFLLRNALGDTTAKFVDHTTAAGIAAGGANQTNSLAAVWADVTGNGRPDLFVTDLSMQAAVRGKLFIHSDTQLGFFTEKAANHFDPDHLKVMQYQAAVDAADINRNGRADLVIGYLGSRGAVVYLNDGDGFFRAEDMITLPGVEHTSGVRLLDLDRDGRLDLVVASAADTVAPKFYRQTTSWQRDLTFFDSSLGVFGAEAGARAEGLLAVDWDRDGFQDLFLGRQTTTDQVYYRTAAADPDSHAVIAVRLASKHGVNNRAGIGARVETDFDGAPMVQWVDGGSGRGGQNDLVLTFPVEQATGQVPVTVTWPNGWAQEVDVPVHTPGSTPYEILDDTNPTVLSNTVSAATEYDPILDVMTLIFTWQTSYGFDPALDKVTLIDPPAQCYMPVTEITKATPGAELVTARLSTGNYEHVLRWTGWQCVVNCTFPYTVTSGHRDGITSTSVQKQLKIIFCPAQ